VTSISSNTMLKNPLPAPGCSKAQPSPTAAGAMTEETPLPPGGPLFFRLLSPTARGGRASRTPMIPLVLSRWAQPVQKHVPGSRCASPADPGGATAPGGEPVPLEEYLPPYTLGPPAAMAFTPPGGAASREPVAADPRWPTPRRAPARGPASMWYDRALLCVHSVERDPRPMPASEPSQRTSWPWRPWLKEVGLTSVAMESTGVVLESP